MATPPFAGSPFIREMVKRDFKDDFQKWYYSLLDIFLYFQVDIEELNFG
jgi:hypothetical protein